MASAKGKEHVSVRVTENESNESEEISLSEGNSSYEETVGKDKSKSKNKSDSDNPNSDSGQESNDDQVLGNAAWADAIANVLRTKASGKKAILSKAKKDKDLVIKDGKKGTEIEVVGEDGKNLVEGNVDTPLKAKKPKLSIPEAIKRKEKKKEWEKMGRVKPSPLDKEKERALMKIGTKGVVQLFNAVQTHQRTLDAKLKDAGPSEVKKDKVLKSLNKGAFLDLLKTSKKDTNNEDAIEETPDKSWSAGVFNENYMMGAKMRDWGKEIEET